MTYLHYLIWKTLAILNIQVFILYVSFNRIEFLAATFDKKEYLKEHNLAKIFKVFDVNSEGKFTIQSLAELFSGSNLNKVDENLL